MTPGSLNERITRALAFMLRHQPEEFDLELDRFGWGDLEDVILALQERVGADIDEEDVEEAISASDRKRYEIDGDRIRALYGHSFAIDPGEPTEPPDELYIGVGSRDAERAEDSGLRSGRRAFLHLARTEEEATEAGRRAAKDYCVVTVFAGEAYDEGIDFYDRGALFLADEIPVEFIEVGEVQHDGIERDHHRRSRGRRNNDGPRGGRGRRGRRDDRDDDGPRGRGGRDRDRDDRPAPRRDEEREEAPRAETPREEPRREAPRREEPRREEPRREEPRREEGRPQPAAGDDGFGLGLVSGGGGERERDVPRAPRDEAPEPVRERKEAPKREPKPEPRPEPKRSREPEPKADADRGSRPSGFGAGLD